MYYMNNNVHQCPYTKIWEWFEEKDPANSWLSFPLVAIIISAIAWVLDSLF